MTGEIAALEPAPPIDCPGRTLDDGWTRFNRYWSGNLASFVGDYFTIVALPFVALELSGSALVVGTVELAEMAATVVLGVPLGRWADRRDIRATLVGADLARALLLSGLVLALVIGTPSAWWLVPLAFLLGSLRDVHDSAEHALVPSLLADHELIVRANARFGISDGAGQIVGSTLVGVVVGFGTVYALGVDALTFVVASAAAWSIGRVRRAVEAVDGAPSRATASAPAARRRSMVEMLRREDRFWRALVVAVLSNVPSVCFFGQFIVFADTELHLAGWQIGLTFAVQGAGGLVASTLIDRGWRMRPQWLVINPLIVTLVPIVAALSQSWTVVLAGFTLVGAVVARDMTVLGTLQHVGFAAEVQGRVGMIRRIALYSLIAPGSLVAGWTADRYGASTMFVAFGLAGLSAPVAALALGLHRLDLDPPRRPTEPAGTPSVDAAAGPEASPAGADAAADAIDVIGRALIEMHLGVEGRTGPVIRRPPEVRPAAPVE